MKKFNLFLTGLFVLYLFAACSDDDKPTFSGDEVTITGVVFAPDGTTPISGATIYMPSKENQQAKSDSDQGSACPEPDVPNLGYTCSGDDGGFSLTVPINGNTIVISFGSGAFSFDKTITVTNANMNLGNVVMPTGSALNADIAVVTGDFDRMQDILAKLGFGQIGADETDFFNYGKLVLGTENFDLYDGDGSLDSSYPEFPLLFEDNDADGKADIFKYDIVFINCGASQTSIQGRGADHVKNHGMRPHSQALTSSQNSILKQFVEQGGTLYATDWAYDFVEQPFPAYIDFHGSDGTAANEPEDFDVAEIGNGGLSLDANILEPSLSSWFPNVACNEGESCLNADGTVHITDFLAGWAVIDGKHTGAEVSVWVEGNVEWSGGSGVKPLTVSFEAGGGKAIYSSYHTVESVHTPNWRPQERILQYLVFE